MKIFVPFHIKNIGGTSTFAKKFKEGMERRGHEIFFQYRQDYDLLFCIVQAPFKYLLDAKRRGKRIVQRLDGVHYWSVQGVGYPFLNLKAKIIRHCFADYSIYQSNYSRYSVEKFLGKKRIDPSNIIYNGVNLEVFSPHGRKIDLRDTPDQKIFFTASAFRRETQIIPILEALQVYAKKYDSNFKCLIAGTFTNNISHLTRKSDNFGNLIFLGRIANEDLPLYERSADVFIFTHPNTSCPNNVIEAMACGLPICGVADGAMPELVEDKKNARLLPTTGDAFWKDRTYDIETIADNLYHIVQDQNRFSQESIRIAHERFSLETMIEQYERTLISLLK